MKKKRKIRYDRIIVLMFALILITLSICIIFKNKKVNKMIDLTDKTIEYVEKYAKKNELELEKKYQYNYKYDKDKIIGQSINEGTIINKKDKLSIIISSGKLDETAYKENNVNELGRIPVMMYHGIQNISSDDTAYTGGNIDKDGYQRTKEAFEKDLEYYYEQGYRMIRLNDYINGDIDVLLGKSPIVLTFDDGLKNNINVTGLDSNGNIIIDENSAVGVLEKFKVKHPDYNVTATFFVNGGLFEQPQYNDKILKWLVNNGYDVGNHTYSHGTLDTLTTNQVQTEIGKLYQKLDEIIPNKYVNIVALPYGKPYDKTVENFKYILNGTYNNKEYNTVATLRVGWTSDYSPFSSSFDKTYIKRIRAYDNNGQDYDIEMVFKDLLKNRYISDGNKDTIVIKNEDSEYLNTNVNKDVIKY